jgi:hypothetical protein
MQKVDPDAAPVRVPLREWRATVRDIAKLDHQIAEEMGQLAQHVAGLVGDYGYATKLQVLGLRPGDRARVPAVEGPQPVQSPDDGTPGHRTAQLLEARRDLAIAEQ